MLILLIVVIVLTVKKFAHLYGGGERSERELEEGLHAILFWGVISFVVGVLGQASGIYYALQAISRASQISPQATAQGFAQSFTSTIFGLAILLVSAILWMILYARFKKLTAKAA
jgi:biopolymer transport protein ExbB/TolQ